MTSTFAITGLHCASCKALIEDVCSDIPEITSSNLDLSTGRLTVEHDPALSPGRVVQEIEQLGSYKAALV